jgi:hypothetical protein
MIGAGAGAGAASHYGSGSATLFLSILLQKLFEKIEIVRLLVGSNWFISPPHSANSSFSGKLI